MKKTFSAGDIIEAEIKAIAHDGRGMAFLPSNTGRGKAVFIPAALPHQVVKCRIIRDRKGFCEAEPLTVISNPLEPPPCPHWMQCGGCPLQPLPYPDQLFWKNRLAFETMTRIGPFQPEELTTVWHQPHASPRILAFRNKIELAFGMENGALALGFRKHASHDVFNIAQCPTVHASAQPIICALRDMASRSGLTPFANNGVLRFLTLRRAAAAPGENPQWHAILLTSPADRRHRKKIMNMASELLRACPELAGFCHEVRKRNDRLAQGEHRVFYLDRNGRRAGQHTVHMALGGRHFAQELTSFFQTNSFASETLASIARQMDAKTSGPLLDMYCGVGAPGQLTANNHKECLGIELNPLSAQYARQNAQEAGLENWRYVAGDAAALLDNHMAQTGKWRTVLLDPPRGGVSGKALEAIAGLAPEHIIYISCNPATFARDANRLQKSWSLERVETVDMFPHTAHLELCSLWTRKHGA